MSYSMEKTLSLPFEKALQRVRESLGSEGFGVLTEIDMRETLKKKLNVDFRKYTILGACNPPFAYQALQVEDRIGLLLPCNVVVRETADGKVEAAAIDPTFAMQAVGNPKLTEIATQVKAKLSRVIAAL
jgi:uncharacterized protein (DUF302 family)